MSSNPMQGITLDQVYVDSAKSDSKNLHGDVCLVFPVNPSGDYFMDEGASIVKKLLSIGFKLNCYFSVTKENIFVLAKVPPQILTQFAAAIDFKVLLDEHEAIQSAKRGYPGIAPLEITEEPEVSEIRPYQFIYGPYTTDPEYSKLFARSANSSSPFQATDTIKLTIMMMEANRNKGGAHISLRRAVKNGHLKGIFPLHEEEEQQALQQSWVSWSTACSFPWSQPFDRIKSYFGEKIALYFKFLGHYTSWLMFPALIGFIFQMIVACSGNFSHPAMPFFSLFVALWAITMLEFWKRSEKRTAMEWGMVGFEDEQVDRPEYQGDPGKENYKSYIDGSPMTFASPKKHTFLMQQSFSIIITFALIVIGAVTSIYVIRSTLYTTAAHDYAQYIASLLNSVQITIFNFLYSKMADYLTNMENHRTDTEYEDSMIAKLFIFQFVNSYSSFFYLAFIAKYMANPADDDVNVGECGYEDCMVALAINLGIIFGIRLTLSNLIELGEPIINAMMRAKSSSEKSTEQPSKAEEQFQMEVYDPLLGTMNDYAELAIQFGYMAFFVVALPIATAGAFINNYVEIRTDGFKLLRGVQRPLPNGAEDIGTWMSIFSIMSTICVVTNAGIIVFTMKVLDMYDITLRLWMFIGFQWFCFICQFIIQYAIPDEPLDVQIQIKRGEFIVNKLIRRTLDDTDEVAENPLKLDSSRISIAAKSPEFGA